MKVQDIMVKEAKFCHPHTNLSEATALLWETDCGALPVVDEQRCVSGMITDRDICMAVWSKNRLPTELAVADVKPAESVSTCSPEEDIQSALETMKIRRVRRLPVVASDGRLRGILSLNDVALNVRLRDGLSHEDVATTLKAVCEHQQVDRQETQRAARAAA